MWAWYIFNTWDFSHEMSHLCNINLEVGNLVTKLIIMIVLSSSEAQLSYGDALY